MKSLSIHLTDLCNSKCSFCVVASPLYEKDSVDYDGIVRFLEENARSGYTAVNLHGGEPTTHPRFFETLSLIKTLGYPEVHVQTNGILLAREEFVRQAIDAGVSLFIVSLHSHTADSHDALTHSAGGFQKTLVGIQNAKKLGVRVRTNTVVTAQSAVYLIDIARLACELRVDHLNFSNFHPVGSSMFALGATLPRLSDTRPYLLQAIAYALEMGKAVTLEGFPYCSVSEYMNLRLDNDDRNIKMLMRGMVIENYDKFMDAQMRIFGPPCDNCSVRTLCGGLYPEYVRYHGWTEFAAVVPQSVA
jgi:MoaA/NifB/PqqE/SkfB family radical SAM enzyme